MIAPTAGGYHPSISPWQSRRLWSLWDMLKENARDFMDLGHALYDIGVVFDWDKYSAIDPKTNLRKLNYEGEQEVRAALQELIRIAERLNLPVSKVLVERQLGWLDSTPQTKQEFDKIADIFKTEIGAKKCLFLPQHLEKYYEWEGIVSDEVVAAFPKASEEIRAGGTCLAAGLPTACVFHAMRAAEIGVRALGGGLQIKIRSGKPLELAEWREILDGISAAVFAVENLPNSTPNKDADLEFYSEAAAQFRFFKNGWRIRVAHARATYTEPQAVEVIDHVRSFFETLSKRLKEPPS